MSTLYSGNTKFWFARDESWIQIQNPVQVLNLSSTSEPGFEFSPLSPAEINPPPALKMRSWVKIQNRLRTSENPEPVILLQLMVCIWRHGGHVGGTTQRNILSIPLSDPASVGGWHCLPHPKRLIANQEYHAGHFRLIFSHLCGLLLSVDNPQKIFSRLWNVKISILYKKSAGKFEPTYWEKTKLKWPTYTFKNIVVVFIYAIKGNKVYLRAPKRNKSCV